MTNGLDIQDLRTDRPEVGMLSIRNALKLPELLVGRPELVAGEAALQQRIRWVHILESSASINFLSGGELVLTTGLSWPTTPDFGLYVRSLKAVQAAGLVLELGTRFREVPEALVAICNQLEVPLIALHQRIKFVALTEAIHRRLLAEQLDVLRAREAVSIRFRELMSIGVPANQLLEETAQLLGVTVVLEDLAYRVIAYSRGASHCLKFLETWRVDSRLATESEHSTRNTIDVQARGQKWGRLAVLGDSEHLAGIDFVLAQAATALSMEMLSEKHSDHWAGLSHRRLLDMLLERKFSDWSECEHELQAAGFEFSGRTVFGMALQLPSQRGIIDEELRNARLQTLRNFAATIGADILATAHRANPSILVAVLSLKSSTTDPLHELNHLCTRYWNDTGDKVCLAAGNFGTDATTLIKSLNEAVQLIVLNSATTETPALLLPRTQELPLLLQSVLAQPTAQAFPESILGPLLSHDARHGSDLLQVLEAYLKHPTNRTLAATQSHLSRSVFYQRLTVIEELLGRRLDDGSVIATLYVAVLLHRQLHGGAPQAKPTSDGT